MELARVIKTLISASVGLTSLVGTRVYPDVLESGHRLPAISFTVDNINYTYDKDDSDDYDIADFTIIAYANTRAECETLSQYIRVALQRSQSISTINNTQVFSTVHTGEKWDYIDRQDVPGDTSIGQGVFTQDINYRIDFKFTPK